MDATTVSRYIPPVPRTNVLDIDYSIFTMLCKILDLASRWRELVGCADRTPFRLSIYEVEECARVLHASATASPTQELLTKWGGAGMTVGDLAQLLLQLRLEQPLTYLLPLTPLRITAQPAHDILDLVEGQTLQLSCEATGFPFPVYVWFRNKEKVSTRSNGALVISSVGVTDAGEYVCRIHHTYHGDLRHVFTERCSVKVKPSPVPIQRPVVPPAPGQGVVPSIVTQPQSQAIRLGESFCLQCKAVGGGTSNPPPLPPLEYHWVKDGQLLPNKGSCLMVTKAQEGHLGQYVCLVRNSAGTTSSNAAIITLASNNSQPMRNAASASLTILEQPTSQTHQFGGRAIFSVRVSNPTNVHYQWFHKGTPLEGETRSELVVHVRGREAEGGYMCYISTPDGTRRATTDTAKLKFDPTPNAYFACDKVALVFGIATYRSHGPPLPAVEHDIQHTVAALRGMGFFVVALLDLTLAEMKDAVTAFCDLIAPGVYTVFYCAGHGYKDDAQRHYLMPWDARDGLNDSESLCIDEVEAQMQLRQPTLLLLFLDICRRNVEHLNHTRIGRPFVQAESRPNRCIFYAASAGQMAYEEKRSKNPSETPRGIFNRYFVEAIGEKLILNDLFPTLLDKFVKCPYDKALYPQHPEIVNNIAEYGRSLWDPIDDARRDQMRCKRRHDWDLLHAVPQSRVIPISDLGQISLTFRSLAANVLEMTTVPRLGAGWATKMSLTMVDPIVQPVRVTLNQSDQSTSFRLPNIQRLRNHLLLQLGIQLTSVLPPAGSGGQSPWSDGAEKPPRDEHRLATLPINLGRPLIAPLDLGARAEKCMTGGGGVVTGGGRHPMEHSESETSLADEAAEK